MEAAKRCPVVMLLLSMLLNDVINAFVLDRKSKEANELAEALKVIQRAKRRLLDKEDYNSQNTGYFWEESSPYAAFGDRDDLRDDNEVLRELFKEGPEEGVLAEDGNTMLDDEVEEAEMEAQEALDKQELEELFANDDQEDNGAEPKETLSDQEVESLLNTAKETAVKVMTESSNGETPVVKTEIQQVIGVSEPNGDGTNTVKVHEDNWLITPEKTVHNSHEDEKEVPTNEITNGEELTEIETEPNAVNIKEKRSEDHVLAEAIKQQQQEKSEDDSDDGFDLSYIKKFIELEDDENNNLANALNLATRSQVERTDKYIPLEVQYLKQSIKDEETIQAIKEQLGIGSNDEEEQVDEDNDDDEILEDEVFIPNSDLLEGGLPSIRNEEEVEEEQEEAMDINRMLSEKLKKFLLRTAAARQKSSLRKENQEEQWLSEPVNDVREGETETELNPFLRELLNKMYRSRMSKRSWQEPREDWVDAAGEEEEVDDEVPVDEEREEEEEHLGDELTSILNAIEEEKNAAMEVEEGICPSAVKYTDNCAYVRGLGMGLDEEAMDLCNRHQLCYSCGAYYGMDADTCDKGFLGEADRLCNGDESCKDEATVLYFFMLSDHTYTARDRTGFACAAQCTIDFITGTDE